MRNSLVILVLSCFLQSNAQMVADAPFTFWQQMLSEQAVTGKMQCMVFSKNHCMYIGTAAGLYLYNGVTVTAIPLKEIKTANITALHEDANQVLWIGLQNGSILKLHNKQSLLFKPQEGTPASAISKMITDTKGRLWFATKGEGIYLQDDNKIYNINTDDGLGDNYVYDLELLPGNIIAASTDKGLSLCSFIQSKKSVQNFSTANGLPDNIVRCISTDPNDSSTIWLGFQQGEICKFSLHTRRVQLVTVPQLKDKQVNDLLILHQQVWVTTDNSVVQLSRESQLIGTQSPGNPTQLMADAEANIWLISKTGLLKNAGEKLQLIAQPLPGEIPEIHDVWQDEEQNIWYSIKGAIVKYHAAKKQKTIIPLPGVDDKSDITSLYGDKENNLWIGTMGKGIYLLNTKTNLVKRMNGLPGNESMSILSVTGRNSNIWISSLQGIYHTTVTNDEYFFQNLTELSGIGINYIYHIYEDSKQRVWFATDGKGLVMMNNNRFTHYGEKQGLTAKVIYSVTEDKQGNIWCAALQKGLYRFNEKTFTNFGLEKGLPDLDISSLDTDNMGNVFCISRSGYFLIDAITQTVILPGNEYRLGSFNTDLNSTSHTASGVLFHTGNGIFLYAKPPYQQINLPQTSITAVSLFLKEISTPEQKEFAHDENNFSFSFAGVFFSNPALVQYQYKLDGYNNEWQTSKNNEVNFPKLQPGTYTFRVRSSATGFFDNSTEAGYTFTIRKPFWKEWWFVTGIILLVTGFLVYVIKEREKAAQKWQQLQTEKLQSQYETLKNQVNPHFLFNSFNTLLNVIEEDPQKAVPYVEHLSDFYRSIVNMREKDLILLADELKIIEDYFFIQKKRFGKALMFENSITEKEKVLYSIPPLTLQLLAENAIKHNIVSKDHPLVLAMYIKDEILSVSNNLNEKSTREKSEGMGLQNIKNRFQLIAGKEVKIEKTTTHFIVQLPLIKRP